MKKILALILSVLMIISMAACGKEPAPATAPTTEDSLPTTAATEPTTEATEPTTEPPTEPVSKFDETLCAPLFAHWQHEVLLDGDLMALPEFQGGTSFPVTWIFNSDGTYNISPDELLCQEAIALFESQLIDYMVDSRYRMFVAECNRHGRYESYIQKEWVENGKGEQVRQEATDTVTALDLTGRYSALNRTGEYYVEEGILYLDEEAIPFTTDGETLTLTESGEDLTEILSFPLTLNRVPEE